MGPRLGSRGKGSRSDQHRTGGYASMGPRLGSRGKGKDSERERIAFLLQWGRDLEVAESSLDPFEDWPPGLASMGPRLGSRGKIQSYLAR